MSARPLRNQARISSRLSTADHSPISVHSITALHAYLIKTHQQINSNAISQIIKSFRLSQSLLHKISSSLSEMNNSPLPIWNHVMRGLSQSRRPSDALELFDKMREQGLQGNNLTFIYLCKSCARIPNVTYGLRIHVNVLKLGFASYLYVCNALIHMYGFCGELVRAKKSFDEMPERDLVTWNSLICAFSQCKQYEEVLKIFHDMRLKNVKADSITMAKAILACNNLDEWELMDSMVNYIEDNSIQTDVFLGNTLIDAYGKRGLTELAWSVFIKMGVNKNVVSWNAMISAAARNGDLVWAKKVFDEMLEKDVVSWTCMITGYMQAKRYEDAIALFQEMMMMTNVNPDRVMIASVLSACARLGRLDTGIAVHDYITICRMRLDIYVENALIDMYCKCGSVDKAMKVFNNMEITDSVSWTSVICGVAINGEYNRALDLFSAMVGKGIKPIHGTFVGVLLACAHSGLVEEGWGYFNGMQRDYGLVPEMRHYGCVVDLLCRAGELHRAFEFINGMPEVFRDAVVWRMLLSACKIHGDMGLARIASAKVLEVDAGNGVDYVLSSNAYANVGRWEDAVKMREMMDKKDNVLKPLGWSLV